MRAIEAPGPGGPEVLRLAERARPKPKPGEVLIEVVAAGVNRPDLLQREGHYPPPAGASEILGLEVSGTVAVIGEGVTRRAGSGGAQRSSRSASRSTSQRGRPSASHEEAAEVPEETIVRRVTRRSTLTSR
jgi:NADPH:quinone reductase-like Zn-dependent oxidoreductase